MEQAEISIQQVKVFRYISQAKNWVSNHEIAQATGVSLRNVSLHTHRLTSLGILDQAEVYPGHRFRVCEKAEKRNGGYLARLKRAESVFGLSA